MLLLAYHSHSKYKSHSYALLAYYKTVFGTAHFICGNLKEAVLNHTLSFIHS